MPSYKMPKKTFRRKPRAARRKRAGKTTLVNTSGFSPLPSKFVTKLKYAEAVTITGVGMQNYRWRMNSLFDPNYTGGGHQPYGFDQLCAAPGIGLYNRYRVFKVDYVLTVANDSYNIHYATLPANVEVPPINNVSEARENPRCQYAIQNPGGTLKKIRGSLSMPALTGLTRAQYAAGENYQALYNTNPVEHMVLSCFSQGMNDDVSVSMSHTFNILLVFHVEFFDPHVVDQS